MATAPAPNPAYTPPNLGGWSLPPDLGAQQTPGQVFGEGFNLIGNTPLPNITQDPTLQALMASLSPGAGGLSPQLMAEYNAGAGLNALTGQQNASQAMSNAAARNLSGSSIEAQGIENANFNTAMANQQLFGTLSGQQLGATESMAGLQGNLDINQAQLSEQRLSDIVNLLSGYGQMSMADIMAQQEQQSQMWNSIIGGISGAGGAALGGWAYGGFK